MRSMRKLESSPPTALLVHELGPPLALELGSKFHFDMAREKIRDDKMALADFKAKKRGREYLEKRINSTLKEGAELVKAPKGIGNARAH
jgi:hypothetical protein